MLCEIELFYCLAFIMVLYPVVALGWSKVARGTRPGTERQFTYIYHLLTKQ